MGLAIADRRQSVSRAIPIRGLGALVHLMLLETGLAPGRLELEITEGVLINDQSRALWILRRLKALGVKIAMDDFGTGYASLSSLQSFPFDKIKIDQTFVSGVETNEQSAAIVRAVIGLAKALKIPVIAEGVETEGERMFLMLEGCQEMQGYLLGKPGPIASYAELTNGDASAAAAITVGPRSPDLPKPAELHTREG
jgi:EAL domain-containing protein (putative c-di-GMP-specific phosphodiesterase class I)